MGDATWYIALLFAQQFTTEHHLKESDASDKYEYAQCSIKQSQTPELKRRQKNVSETENLRKSVVH
jgi:hypothetical protein